MSEEYKRLNAEERYNILTALMRESVETLSRKRKERKNVMNDEQRKQLVNPCWRDTAPRVRRKDEGRRVNPSSIRRKRNPVEWWDDECEKAIKSRRTAQREYAKRRMMECRIEFKKTIAEARKIIKREKKENFKNFAGTLNKYTNLSYVWEKMKIFKDRDNNRE